MSSGSRNEELEGLLAALYALRTCDESEKAACHEAWLAAVAECLKVHPTVSRMDLIEALNMHYVDYARNRRGYERPRGNVIRS